jgi:hypothetical protein
MRGGLRLTCSHGMAQFRPVPPFIVASQPPPAVTKESEVLNAVPADVSIVASAPAPVDDPTLGIPVSINRSNTPPHRLVTIGDSLFHGFQSGAVYQTDLSVPAIIAYELGWLDSFRHPTYGGPGGLPLNVEVLLRHLQQQFGLVVDWWEIPPALFSGRRWLDELEDYWERGAGSAVTAVTAINHNLAVYGWDLRDALTETAQTCLDRLTAPKDNLVNQVIENNGERAALRVYPTVPAHNRTKTVFELAQTLGTDVAIGAGNGIETLIVSLGANNALSAVTQLRISWSDTGFDDPARKAAYTVWRPTHFAAELALVATAVQGINARHVIWCTVPHVTVAPIACGIGPKLRSGSRYFSYYTRPWITDDRFDPARHRHITGDDARAIDSAIDQYNDAFVDVVRTARRSGRDWYVLDIAGVLDRLAARRYIDDPAARPPWWTPYPLPPALAAINPLPNSLFLATNGSGGRARGGLFSLDGVHPTTVGYGVLADELVKVMRSAGVEFRQPDGVTARPDPVTVDFDRLIRRDTLLHRPPANLDSSLATLAWADEALGLVNRALPF